MTFLRHNHNIATRTLNQNHLFQFRKASTREKGAALTNAFSPQENAYSISYEGLSEGFVRIILIITTLLLYYL